MEGAHRSGALITAGLSLEFGREVFAVPGEAGRRLSVGPHQLLRQGAYLCECPADVVRERGEEDGAFGDPSELAPAAPQLLGIEGAQASAVLRSLESGPLTADAATVASELSVHTATATLSALEMEGLVRRCDGGGHSQKRGLM